MAAAQVLSNLEGIQTIWFGNKENEMEDEPIVIDRTLTIDQVAKVLGVHRGTIYRIAGQKGFPTGVKIGGRRRFFLSSLQAYIEKLKAKGG